MQNKDNSLLPARYLTDPAVLHDPSDIYADEARLFQGIPALPAPRAVLHHFLHRHES